MFELTPELEAQSSAPAGSRRLRPAAIVFTALLAAALAGAGYLAVIASGGDRGTVLAGEFPEPSDIVYHPQTGTLFIVGDEGTIGEMATAGKILRGRSMGKRDFEGLTVDPASGLLYALIEGENVILEINPVTFDTPRRFAIDGRYEGQTLVAKGAENLEGIAFVPDPKHPESGRFFITNRGVESNGPRAEKNRSFLAELAVPLKTSVEKSSEVRIVAAWPLRVSDVTALTWVARRQFLGAVCDGPDLYIEMTLTGEIRSRSKIPGKKQEGIAFDDAGAAYIAQDGGGILKLEGFAAGK
jgi:hypothetical protein